MSDIEVYNPLNFCYLATIFLCNFFCLEDEFSNIPVTYLTAFFFIFFEMPFLHRIIITSHVDRYYTVKLLVQFLIEIRDVEGSTEVSSITIRPRAIPIIVKAEVQTILDLRSEATESRRYQYKTTYYCDQEITLLNLGPRKTQTKG